MPAKPEPNKALMFNVSVKVTATQLDALDVIRRVTGKAAGTVFREAFEDQVAGIVPSGDKGYQAVRDWRQRAPSGGRILSRTAWADNWKKVHGDDEGN